MVSSFPVERLQASLFVEGMLTASEPGVDRLLIVRALNSSYLHPRAIIREL